jgi:type I restriction enzyme, S subunit
VKTKYPVSSLENICVIKGGKRLPKGEYLVDEVTNHPYIRARDIRKGKVESTAPKYLTDEVFSKIKKYIVDESDVIITIVGENIGDVAYITAKYDKANLTENAVKLTANRKLLDPKFLMYSLVPDYMKQYFQIVSAGAAQGKLGLYKIRKAQIPFPNLYLQQKIVAVLFAYDGLIEKNLQRIKLLEEMAQITYEEWFVSQRVNGVKVSDGEIEVSILEDLIKEYKNGGWGKEKVEGSYSEPAYVIRGTDIPDVYAANVSKIPLRYHTKKNLESRRLMLGDISIEMSNGNIGNVGRSCYFDVSIKDQLGTDAMCASFCKMLRPNSIELSYIIDAHLKYIHKNNKMLAYKSQGANGINNFQFGNLITEEQLPLPLKDTFDRFVKKLEKSYRGVANLRSQIQFLSEARDILLPRLMSGMINIDKVVLPDVLLDRIETDFKNTRDKENAT